MTRKTKALSGASQDAYFRRILKTYPNISDEAREHVVRQLRKEVSQLRVRMGVPRDGSAPAANEQSAAPAIEARVQPAVSSAAVEKQPGEPMPLPTVARADAKVFDPFAVNVVVVLRTSGRDAALAALTEIGNADNLRLLAREQQLSVSGEIASAEELSAAIIAAAERRIANRRAAAGAR